MPIEGAILRSHSIPLKVRYNSWICWNSFIRFADKYARKTSSCLQNQVTHVYEKQLGCTVAIIVSITWICQQELVFLTILVHLFWRTFTVLADLSLIDNRFKDCWTFFILDLGHFLMYHLLMSSFILNILLFHFKFSLIHPINWINSIIHF